MIRPGQVPIPARFVQEWATLEQAAIIAGISRQTLINRLNHPTDSKPPWFKVGRMALFERVELERWLRQCTSRVIGREGDQRRHLTHPDDTTTGRQR